MEVSDKPCVVAVIPAYNEGETIGSIVRKCLVHARWVIVADDGSTDRTSENAKEAGAIVVELRDNGGKGKAQRMGFDEALRRGADVIVYLDGDGQHDPAQIPLLTRPILEGNADLVIGSRQKVAFPRTEIPLYRRIGLGLLDFLVSLGTDSVFHDSQSGFRAMSSFAAKTMELHQDGMAIETEILFEASRLRLRVTQVPVFVRYDVENPSKLNPMLHYYQVSTATLGMLQERNPKFLPGVFGSVAAAFACVAFAVFLFDLSGHGGYESGIIALMLTLLASIMFCFGLARTKKG